MNDSKIKINFQTKGKYKIKKIYGIILWLIHEIDYQTEFGNMENLRFCVKLKLTRNLFNFNLLYPFIL